MTGPLLLDTCAIVWLSQDHPIADDAAAAIASVKRGSGQLGISVMSAWEIGILTAKGRLTLTRPPLNWFTEFVERSGVTVFDVNPAILVASSYLPFSSHGDPMDRILIATARERNLTIVTRDQAILSYGAAGHVKTLAC